jgi:UDP-N-acetylmuramyl pentapeptide phosphotransferase/UDP-N-acetylglucosamine-1-phosphate transferase
VLVVAFVVGALAVRFLVVSLAHVLKSPVLMRANYRGHRIPTSAGVLIAVAVLIVEAGRSLIGALGAGNQNVTPARNLMLVCVLGFALLGLIDDLLGDPDGHGGDRGFVGHVKALKHGRVTTGMLKLAGGAGIAIVLVATPGFPSGRTLIVDALLVALAANLGNLFDRAPGRVIKISLFAYVPLVVVLGLGPVGVALAPVMGATAGLLGDDLRERLMLGDAGSNVIGAALGLAVVLGCAESTRVTVLIVIAVLNIAAELFSFSQVIDAIAPLRVLDRFGALPARQRAARVQHARRRRDDQGWQSDFE